jgi:hypothetical protein
MLSEAPQQLNNLAKPGDALTKYASGPSVRSKGGIGVLGARLTPWCSVDLTIQQRALHACGNGYSTFKLVLASDLDIILPARAEVSI